MALLETKIARASSTIIRLASYIFLRWGAGPPLPPLVFTLLPIYVSTFIASYLDEPDTQLVDEIDVAVTEVPLKNVAINGRRATANGNDAIVAEVVDVQETISVQPRSSKILQTLLLGSPSPRSLAASALTFLTNLLCVGMVADRLFREHQYPSDDLSFVRLGYVSDTEAKLLIREPDQSKMPVTVQIHIKDAKAPFDNPLWQTAGGVRSTSNETDFTGVLTIPLRHAKQRTYEWTSSNNHSGQFTSPPSPGHKNELNNGQFTFLSTSCVLSRLPYDPRDHPLAIPGMRHLAKVLPTLNAQFMLFLGDFIYVDVPRRWGSAIQDYREKYRQIYASPDWEPVGQNLSWIHVLDDHEISNDWSSNTTGVYRAAIDPWDLYHKAANPPLAKSRAFLAPRHTATYFEFTQGPASFFMLDTRSYRSSNNLPFADPDKTMLGEEQLDDFIAWLKRPEPRGVKWKIVASSVPFTKNWPVNTKDTWGGFLAERREVLEAMWDVGTRGIGVVVLSGDRHEFAATKFPPPVNDTRWTESSTVYEFSASPLSQFYSPIGSYRQTDNEDIMIKYVHKGNSKFGAITIETLEQGGQSSLKYRLFVDGIETWNTMLLSPAVASGEVKPGSFWERLTRP